MSKQCCPICEALLSSLKKLYVHDVDILGAHRTITPCTLPPWLPDDILDDVVGFFERKLGDALIGLSHVLQCNRGRPPLTVKIVVH